MKGPTKRHNDSWVPVDQLFQLYFNTIVHKCLREKGKVKTSENECWYFSRENDQFLYVGVNMKEEDYDEVVRPEICKKAR